MSPKLSKGLWAVAALALSGTLILGSGRRISARPAPPEHESSHGSELQGTWRVQVQPYNTQTITQNIEFKGGPDQSTSGATIEFADTKEAIYRSGCATATAQRLELE